jgi:hypothetical protein
VYPWFDPQHCKIRKKGGRKERWEGGRETGREGGERREGKRQEKVERISSAESGTLLALTRLNELTYWSPGPRAYYARAKSSVIAGLPET